MGWITESFGKGIAARDNDGQPLPIYRASAVADRQIDELIGLIKGVLADGAVCQGEVEFLLRWMEANRASSHTWPAKALYPRVAAALEDGHLDEHEESEIMSLLLATVGGNQAPFQGEASDSTSLPLCSPYPAVEIASSTFCFTGKFTSGTRNWCQQQVHDRGGFSTNSITRKVSFLVIGDIGSRDWIHSTHGRKIQKAIDYRDSGVPLHIVNEQHWHEHLA